MSVPNAPASTLTWEGLGSLFPEFPGSSRWLSLLERHAELIASARSRVRVTSVRDEDIVRRHYAESLEILRIAGELGWGGLICDVGSGGGYPGMVFAAVIPDTEVHLVEPLQKRARLLEWMAQELGMANVRVHAERAEEAGRGPLRDGCGLVTARAVAELRELLEYTAPLAAEGGLLAIPKGSALESELAASSGAMQALSIGEERRVAMRDEISEHVEVLSFRKRGVTPAAYPRRPGVPGKRPL